MRKRFLRIVNSLAGVWFWGTIIGAFYIGVTYVLPAVYEENDDLWITNDRSRREDKKEELDWISENFISDQQCRYTIQYYVAVFLLLEMVVNWLCIKTVKSNFQPDIHAACNSADCNKDLNDQQQIELNLNHLKPNIGGNTGSYTIPANSIYNNNGYSTPKNGATLYLMSIPAAADCCDMRGCNTNGHSSTGTCGIEGGDPLKMCHDRPSGLVFPYWSWKPCFICQVHRPPRTHHCVLCGTCVLKRDHHCFFTGSCIGLFNQRHFIVFTFWSFAATLYSLIHAAIYTFTHFTVRNSLLDLFLPATLTRWCLGCVSGFDTLMVCLLYSLIWFCFTSFGFFLEQLRLVASGVTSFEIDNKIKIVNTNSKIDNIRGVFGKKWLLNFVFPLHTLYRQRDDGVHWNNIKL